YSSRHVDPVKLRMTDFYYLCKNLTYAKKDKFINEGTIPFNIVTCDGDFGSLLCCAFNGGDNGDVESLQLIINDLQRNANKKAFTFIFVVILLFTRGLVLDPREENISDNPSEEKMNIRS
ncbi:6440_t:CDS:2, partial [Entrophospora sp. SA101]